MRERKLEEILTGAIDLASPSDSFFHLIESQGLTGAWSWVFADNRHVWSPGLFRLLGLEPNSIRPSYSFFMSLVHPEDRPVIDFAPDVVHGHLRRANTFRIIQPDGRVRTLSASNEVLFAPDGRPREARGIILDATDHDRLVRARRIEQTQRRLLYLHARIMTFSISLDLKCDFLPEAAEVTGRPIEEMIADPFGGIVPEERAGFHDRVLEHFDLGVMFQGDPLVRLAGDVRDRLRVVAVPVRNVLGEITEWSGLLYPLREPGPLPVASLREGLDQAVQGYHLRAARGLLDWSMMDLAQASNLSFSTVRRLEEDGEVVTARSRDAALSALRRHGVDFVPLEDGVLGVVRR